MPRLRSALVVPCSVLSATLVAGLAAVPQGEPRFCSPMPFGHS